MDKPKPDTEDVFLSTAEVCQRLGRSRSTLSLWRLRSVGPPCFLVGGRMVYRLSALTAWLEQQERATGRGDTA